LFENNFHGDVKLLANASGTVNARPYYTHPQYPNHKDVKLNQIAGIVTQEHLQNISINSDGESIDLRYGKYEAKYRTTSSVTVNPVNTNRTASYEGYTYNVNPKIVKEN